MVCLVRFVYVITVMFCEKAQSKQSKLNRMGQSKLGEAPSQTVLNKVVCFSFNKLTKTSTITFFFHFHFREFSHVFLIFLKSLLSYESGADLT